MRSGYSDDLEQQALAMWRGRVASAIRGKRGQRLLREALAALDAMPAKRLIDEELVRPDGEVCLLGAVGQRLGVADLATIDPEEHEMLASRFDVAPCLIQEIEHVNDEIGGTPERRYECVRKWLIENIKDDAPAVPS
jgi:hypothetical protein